DLLLCVRIGRHDLPNPLRCPALFRIKRTRRLPPRRLPALAVGTYRWIAHYSGDANNNGFDTACNDANESSTIVKASPGLTTTATAGPVVVGGNIHDVAHLTGGFGTLGGTITFHVVATGVNTCPTPTPVPPPRSCNETA